MFSYQAMSGNPSSGADLEYTIQQARLDADYERTHRGCGHAPIEIIDEENGIVVAHVWMDATIRGLSLPADPAEIARIVEWRAVAKAAMAEWPPVTSPRQLERIAPCALPPN